MRERFSEQVTDLILTVQFTTDFVQKVNMVLESYAHQSNNVFLRSVE
jgi:hypothetical protein